MIEANPQSLIFYPGVAMSRFGKTSPEFGMQNLFRVIWAPSRKVTLVFRGQTRTVRVYGGGQTKIKETDPDPQDLGVHSMEVLDARLSKEHKKSECWILEIWKPCWDLTHKTEAEWNADPASVAQGPYPKNGDYVLSEPFFNQVPSLESIEKLILLVRDGFMRKRPVDNALAIRDRVEKKDQSDYNARIDIIKNRSLIGSGEAYSGGKYGRGTKTIPMNLTTKDISWAGMPIPTSPGVTAGMPKGRKRYQIAVK